MCMDKYTCDRCQREFNSYESLRKHVGRVHKVHSTNFFVEFNLNGEWPRCKCGCNEKVEWSSLRKEFCDYCQGHQSRVKNNWGHNPKAIEASSKTRREQFRKGERQSWNVGLTKDTDNRVKLNGESSAKSYTKERKETYSNRMSKMRKDGTIPNLSGENHSQWSGGVSSIKSIAHCSPKLHQEWRYPIFIRDRFKCAQCQSPNRLQVHHNAETMASIVRKFVPTTAPSDLSFEKKKELAEKIVDYHISNAVSGITLCMECHNKLHPSLNFV